MKKLLKSIFLGLVLCVGVIALTACGEEKEPESIIGVWKHDSGNYIYTFNEDGTGEYNVYENPMIFTYTTEGNSLSILYNGNTAPFETTYSIKGDTLNVKDSNGNDTLYKKQ